jgi:hypothetical protein
MRKLWVDKLQAVVGPRAASAAALKMASTSAWLSARPSAPRKRASLGAACGSECRPELASSGSAQGAGRDMTSRPHTLPRGSVLEEQGRRLKPPSGRVHAAALRRLMASSFRMPVRHMTRNMARTEVPTGEDQWNGWPWTVNERSARMA